MHVNSKIKKTCPCRLSKTGNGLAELKKRRPLSRPYHCYCRFIFTVVGLGCLFGNFMRKDFQGHIA